MFHFLIVGSMLSINFVSTPLGDATRCAEIEKKGKIWGFAFQERQNKAIRVKFGTLVYIAGLLQCAKFGHDHIAWSAG